MCSLPAIPKYILDIPEPNELKARADDYTKAYQAEFNKYNDRWDGLKAIMSSIAAIAIGIFASLALSLWAAPLVLVVGAIIAVDLLSIGASICLPMYYGSKADDNCKNIREIEDNFHKHYQMKFNAEQANAEKMKNYQPSAPTLQPALTQPYCVYPTVQNANTSNPQGSSQN